MIPPEPWQPPQPPPGAVLGPNMQLGGLGMGGEKRRSGSGEVMAVKPCNLSFVSRAAQSPAEASQTLECEVPALVAGAFAKLHSLTREWRHLNGAHGELIEYRRASGKWHVRICQNGRKQTKRKTKLYVHPKNLTLVQAPYRFTINTVVYCSCSLSPFIWEKGRVVQTHWEDDDGNFHPYQVRLDDGRLIYAPVDKNETIRSFESEPLTPEQNAILKKLDTLYDDEEGNAKDILAMHDQALSVAYAVQGNWPELAVEIFRALASSFETTGQYTLALELRERNEALALQIKNKAVRAYVFAERGNVLSSMGEHAKAVELLTKSLAIARELKDREEEAACLCNIGINLNEMGREHEAIALYEEQLVILKDLDAPVFKANALANLADSYRMLGQYHKSLEYGNSALSILQNLKS